MGTIFSIEEFSIHDGPGIRTSVFFKGCPLRCNWCHSPESWLKRPQILKSPNGCVRCGNCERVCNKGEGECSLCQKCIASCKRNLIRVSGYEITAENLVNKLLKNADILNSNDGGVTLTGGEVFFQSEFLNEVLDLLYGKIHIAIQTSGFADSQIFESTIRKIDLVMFDLKLFDEQNAKKFTTKSSKLILLNLEILKRSDVSFIARIPLIPTITDTQQNLECFAELLKDASNLLGVELLPYNKFTGSKYHSVKQKFSPMFDENIIPSARLEIFKGLNVPIRML